MQHWRFGRARSPSAGLSTSAPTRSSLPAHWYGLPAKKIKEYLDLLVQCEAAAAAAVEAAEEAAVKAAVEAGKEVRLEAATAAKLQGKPFAKCSWREGIRQLEDALQAREAYRAGLRLKKSTKTPSGRQCPGGIP